MKHYDIRDFPGYVYFVRREDTGAIKVGATNNVNERFQHLGWETKANLSLLLVLLVDSPLRTERAIQNRLAKYVVPGTREWFHINWSHINKVIA